MCYRKVGIITFCIHLNSDIPEIFASSTRNSRCHYLVGRLRLINPWYISHIINECEPLEETCSNRNQGIGGGLAYWGEGSMGHWGTGKRWRVNSMGQEVMGTRLNISLGEEGLSLFWELRERCEGTMCVEPKVINPRVASIYGLFEVGSEVIHQERVRDLKIKERK